MPAIPDIIQSDIVNTNIDAYWATLPDGLPTSPVKALVVTQPYAAGSVEETQLQKILQACKLEPTEYYIHQLQQPVAWHQFRDKLSPQVVLLFGVFPQQLGVSAMFSLYYPNKFDSCIWVPSISISEMEKHPDTKKQLWVDGLKPVFVDKAYGNI